MNKHIIAYSLLVLTIVVMAGQISSPDNENVQLNEPKTVIVEPDDYKTIKSELKNAKLELEKKDNLISKLNSRIDDKTSEIEKIKKAKLADLKPEVEKKKNPLLNILSSADKYMDNPQVQKMMKKGVLRRYASLFKRLNLDEAQKEKLIELIMARDKQKQEKLMSMFSEQSDGAEFKIENLQDLNQKTDADKEIEELLGNDYDSFDYYEKTAMERMQLDNINTSLSDDDKLSIEQEDQLVGLLKQRNDDIRSGNKKSDEEYIAESSVFLNDNQSAELGKSLKRSGNGLGAMRFFNGGGGTSSIQVIETVE